MSRKHPRPQQDGRVVGGFHEVILKGVPLRELQARWREHSFTPTKKSVQGRIAKAREEQLQRSIFPAVSESSDPRDRGAVRPALERFRQRALKAQSAGQTKPKPGR